MTTANEAPELNSKQSSIFVSYRRKDTGGHTGRLYDRLIQRFDVEDIFYDQSGIVSGDDFPQAIQNALDSAQVILIVVGPDWLSIENRKRLDDPKDFVRREVLSALSRVIKSENKPLVVPVLVGDAEQLAEVNLPDDLRQLTFIQSHLLPTNLADYNHQIEELCKIVGKHSRSWTAKLSQWLLSCLSDKNLSSANFSQDLTVLRPESHYIQRASADETLNFWWSEWQEHNRPFVLLGEEGDGKTWAVSSWIAKTISFTGNQLPVVFISATKVTKATDFISEMADAMAKANDSISAIEWESRLKLFLTSRVNNLPQIVLIVDGLNERPSLDWRDFFDNYFASRFQKNIALIVTCRNGYWNDHLVKEYTDSVSIWQLSPFNDDELDHALARHHLTRASFSDRVLKLVAKPRYFDMAVRLKDQLEESGDDVTIDRLIYEDWRDRLGRKRLQDVKISHTDFLSLITELVKEYAGRASAGELAQTLSVYGHQAEIRAELVSSGILRDVGGGKFEVAPNSLILGLGLLLANEIEKSGKGDILEVEEIIAELLGPHPDSDRLVQICAMALFHALLTDSYPDAGRIALFRKWISGRNLDEADSERVSAYFPLKPQVYFHVMENLWGTFGNYREVEDHLMSAMLQPHNFDHVKEEMVATFERWLGFVFPLGYRGLFDRDESKKEDLIKKLEDRLGQQVELGNKEFFGHRIEIVADQRLLQLANVAESVISHFDLAPFVRALCNGAVATAVMGGSNVDYRWVVRTAPSKVQTALLAKAREFIGTFQSLALRAADYLLFWICSEESIALREEIPEDLSSRSWNKKFLEEDGSNSSIYLWSEENYLDYLQRTNLSPINIAEDLRDVAINPDCTIPEELLIKFDSAIDQIEYKVNEHRSQTREDIAIEHMEPALCAYMAKQYAELFRKLANQLNGQNFLSCHLSAGKLYEHLPVFTELERESIIKAWRMTLASKDKEAHSAELTLFPMVVFDRSSDEQFLLLKERGGKTGYFSRKQARYREITFDCLNSVIETLDGYDESNPEACYAVLDYLAKTLSTIDDRLRERLLNLLQSSNSITRYLCLEIIYNTNDQIAANAVLKSEWKADCDNCDYENDWGSILLAHFAKHLSLEDLVGRILLRWLGYAVRERGNRPEEIAEYALRLHVIWTRIAMPTEGDEAILRHLKVGICQSRNDIDEEVTIDLNENFGLKWTKFTWGGTSGAIREPFDESMANARLEKIYNQVSTGWVVRSLCASMLNALKWSVLVACHPE